MKETNTGIVRRIDYLGRVVVPKEVRRTLKIREGDPLEIGVEGNKIIFTKYSSVDSRLRDLGKDIVKALHMVTGCDVFITDMDRVLYVCGEGSNRFVKKSINKDLIQIIDDGEVITKPCQFITLENLEGISYHSQLIIPIRFEMESIGSIVLITEKEEVTDVQMKLVSLAMKIMVNQLKREEECL